MTPRQSCYALVGERNSFNVAGTLRFPAVGVEREKGGEAGRV